MPQTEYEQGYQKALLDTLAADMAEVKTAVNQIKQTLDERRGERRVGMVMLTTASAVIGAVGAIIARHLGLGA